MNELRMGRKKNERPVFGKGNPNRAEEGSIKTISTRAATIFQGPAEQARQCPLLDDVSLAFIGIMGVIAIESLYRCLPSHWGVSASTSCDEGITDRTS
jgi:hypothetical protein